MSHRGVDGREDDMVKSMAIALYGDESIRGKGWPKANLRISFQKRLAS